MNGLLVLLPFFLGIGELYTVACKISGNRGRRRIYLEVFYGDWAFELGLTRILCLVYTSVLMDGCLHLEALMGLLKSGMHLQETSSVHLNILVEASSESGSIEENIWGIVQFGCGMLTEVPTFYWENLVPPSFTSLFLFQFHL
uniref:Uncharacterized protein n=1 Tax=Vitis vinifera TaxID=29760 RepID=F6HGW3_VITVI